LRIAILGGYGMFGARLAYLLSDARDLTIVIAGRSAAKANAVCEGLARGAARETAYFDRDADIESQLRTIAPTLVVDATGPFQAYGTDPYRVVKACLALGIDYMDFADGSEFVKGVEQFDAMACSRGVHILSGVSSFPVLTAAVVRRLSRGLQQIATITGGIAPSPFANVGPNVIRAIAGYSGKAVTLVRDARPTAAYALTETMRYTIAPPGYLPLRNLHFSLVDVPEYRVFADLWPGVQSVWMGAAPVPEVLHRLLNVLAHMVRRGILSSLLPLANLMYRAINLLHWGEHRGGMFVAIEGTDVEGREVKRSWHLVAEEERGPMIPSMAIEMLVRRTLAGRRPEPGARAATRELELDDYEAVFGKREIRTGFRSDADDDEDLPLYRRLLGSAWQELPPTVRAMHECRAAEGLASVERGGHLLALMVGAVMRFPAAGNEVPVKVFFQKDTHRETWRRTFGKSSFASVHSAGLGRSHRLLCEQFGPISIAMALVVDHERLYLVVRRWTFFGIPLPLSLAPGGTSYEFERDGRFHFNVEIGHKWTGPIVAYRGWLEPDSEKSNHIEHRQHKD
jgi:hypothetical protein